MNDVRKKAFKLIILLGLISLLGDIIYEGGRSVHGQYLNILGVSATVVGFIIGSAELIGYFFRLASGYFADITGSYWFFTILGYSLLFSIPLISLTKMWEVVAFLVILERIGKGVRTPARDTIASHAARQIGTGYGFGIAEFIDQIGGIIGPAIFTSVFAKNINSRYAVESYQHAYGLLWLPFILLLFILFFTYFKFKESEKLEKALEIDEFEKRELNLSKKFYLYVFFVFLTTAGFVHFPMVGFHLRKSGIISDTYIPLLYATSMMIDAIAGVVYGKVYDLVKEKNKTQQGEYNLLLLLPLTSIFVPFLVFSQKPLPIILGSVLLGSGIGFQETIMKAVVADMTPMNKRSSAYGTFSLISGLGIFAGSALAGYLYDHSLPLLIIILPFIEILSIPVLYMMRRIKE